jgi:fumarate reductase subunit D
MRTSLEQNHNVVAAPSHIPMTGTFVQAVTDFIANKSIEKIFILKKINLPLWLAYMRGKRNMRANHSANRTNIHHVQV